MTAETYTVDLKDPALFSDFRDLSLKVRKRPLVLFFGRPTFSDNTKYLFLSCIQTSPGFEVMWCTWDKALHETLRHHQLPSILMSENIKDTVDLLLEAAAAVFCENTASAYMALPVVKGCLEGAKKIQLWHGISVKHLDLMLTRKMNLLDRNLRQNTIGATDFDFIASSSAALDPFWYRAFGSRNILRVGQPRNEVLVRNADDNEFIGAILSPEEQEPFAAGAPKFLIAPTWQRNKPLWTSSDQFYGALETIGLQSNCYFYIKQHPFLANRPGSNQSTQKYRHVIFMSPSIDIYPWMRHFSALITDYSSIMFDFLLTGKPVLTYSIPASQRLSFEPDYSLVPDIAFSYAFDEESFAPILAHALNEHPMRDKQRAMCDALYETDPSESCNKLNRFLEECVSENINKPVSIYNL